MPLPGGEVVSSRPLKTAASAELFRGPGITVCHSGILPMRDVVSYIERGGAYAEAPSQGNCLRSLRNRRGCRGRRRSLQRRCFRFGRLYGAMAGEAARVHVPSELDGQLSRFLEGFGAGVGLCAAAVWWGGKSRATAPHDG